MYFESLIVTYPLKQIKNFLYGFSSNLLFKSKFFVDNSIEKVVCLVFYVYIFDFITQF